MKLPTNVADWRPAFRAAALRCARFSLIPLAFAALVSCGSDDNGYSSGPPTGTTRELDSGDLGPGAMYQHRFMTAGTFGYHCIYHAPMTGSVVVNASAPDTLVSVSIVSSSSPFPPASVKPGGRVVWTNNTSLVHTVTSN